jgi:hypothetical protein
MIRNNVNSTLEIEAAPLATPEKPNKPATTATTSAMIAHCKRSILLLLPSTGLFVLLIVSFDNCPCYPVSGFFSSIVLYGTLSPIAKMLHGFN